VKILLLRQQQAQQHMMFLLRLRQATKELTHSVSRPQGKKICVKRDREQGHDRLYEEYFEEDSIYNEYYFCCRFRMRRHLFLRIVEVLGNQSKYFQLRYDATKNRGLTSLTKCAAAT